MTRKCFPFLSDFLVFLLLLFVSLFLGFWEKRCEWTGKEREGIFLVSWRRRRRRRSVTEKDEQNVRSFCEVSLPQITTCFFFVNFFLLYFFFAHSFDGTITLSTGRWRRKQLKKRAEKKAEVKRRWVLCNGMRDEWEMRVGKEKDESTKDTKFSVCNESWLTIDQNHQDGERSCKKQ